MWPRTLRSNQTAFIPNVLNRLVLVRSYLVSRYLVNANGEINFSLCLQESVT